MPAKPTFDKLTAKLEQQGQSPASAKKIAASIGKRKYGAATMAAKAKAGRKR